MNINTIYCGDANNIMRGMPDNFFDSIVTDPPAGISFMGKDWDNNKGGRDHWIEWMSEVAKECLRVLKPGGHALVWSLPRTSHWTGTAWENAGFEVRDVIAHVFGQGFPKSMNMSKAIDKYYGVERVVMGKGKHPTLKDTSKTEAQANAAHGDNAWKREWDITGSATREAMQWEGWGTALKPAREDWWLLRKPISEKTVAENVLKWGTGAINIDGCRIEINENIDDKRLGGKGKCKSDKAAKNVYEGGYAGKEVGSSEQGRYPANLIHDGNQTVLDLFPEQKSGAMKKPYKYKNNGNSMGKATGETKQIHESNSGSAARFFYCTKATKKDREEGLEDFERLKAGQLSENSTRRDDGYEVARRANNHPTVKSTRLMQYLCRLVTPPNGIILDPFAGSGSTGKGALREGFKFIGIEKDQNYADIANARLQQELQKQPA